MKTMNSKNNITTTTTSPTTHRQLSSVKQIVDARLSSSWGSTTIRKRTAITAINSAAAATENRDGLHQHIARVRDDDYPPAMGWRRALAYLRNEQQQEQHNDSSSSHSDDENCQMMSPSSSCNSLLQALDARGRTPLMAAYAKSSYAPPVYLQTLLDESLQSFRKNSTSQQPQQLLRLRLESQFLTTREKQTGYTCLMIALHHTHPAAPTLTFACPLESIQVLLLSPSSSSINSLSSSLLSSSNNNHSNHAPSVSSLTRLYHHHCLCLADAQLLTSDYHGNLPLHTVLMMRGGVRRQQQQQKQLELVELFLFQPSQEPQQRIIRHLSNRRQLRPSAHRQLLSVNHRRCSATSTTAYGEGGGWTPLHVALHNGLPYDIIETLIMACPAALSSTGQCGYTPIIAALQNNTHNNNSNSHYHHYSAAETLKLLQLFHRVQPKAFSILSCQHHPQNHQNRKCCDSSTTSTACSHLYYPLPTALERFLFQQQQRTTTTVPPPTTIANNTNAVSHTTHNNNLRPPSPRSVALANVLSTSGTAATDTTTKTKSSNLSPSLSPVLGIVELLLSSAEEDDNDEGEEKHEDDEEEYSAKQDNNRNARATKAKPSMAETMILHPDYIGRNSLLRLMEQWAAASTSITTALASASASAESNHLRQEQLSQLLLQKLHHYCQEATLALEVCRLLLSIGPQAAAAASSTGTAPVQVAYRQYRQAWQDYIKAKKFFSKSNNNSNESLLTVLSLKKERMNTWWKVLLLVLQSWSAASTSSTTTATTQWSPLHAALLTKAPVCIVERMTQEFPQAAAQQQEHQQQQQQQFFQEEYPLHVALQQLLSLKKKLHKVKSSSDITSTTPVVTSNNGDNNNRSGNNNHDAGIKRGSQKKSSHCSISRRPLFRLEWTVSILLKACPAMARQPTRKDGRYPLAMAAEYGLSCLPCWNELIQAYPDALRKKDSASGGLYPLLICAASSGSSGTSCFRQEQETTDQLEAIYELLKAAPEIVSFRTAVS